VSLLGSSPVHFASKRAKRSEEKNPVNHYEVKNLEGVRGIVVPLSDDRSGEERLV